MLIKRLSIYICRFLKGNTGATAIEYALVASLVSIVIMFALGNVGTTINELYYSKVVEGFGR